MKKVVFALSLLLVSLVGNAQGVKHMNFNGIPIDGTQQNFETKLLNNGFKKAVWKGYTFLEGSFLNEPVRIQTEIGPRTGKIAIVACLAQKECNGQTILNEVERWKTKICSSFNTHFYESRNMYKADVQSPGRGVVSVDYLQSDPTQELYVVRIAICDLENVGK